MCLFGFSWSKNLWIVGPIIVIILSTYMLKRWAMLYGDQDKKKKAKIGELCGGGGGGGDRKNMYQEVSSKSGSGSISWSFYCCNTSNGVIKTYTLEELKVATRDFRFRIGVGATSFVYLAVLGDGRFGAVKRVMVDRGGSKKMFLDEVSVLLRISHPNLVGLLGFCLEKGEQLLLLEYVPNKSLFERMHTFHGQALGVLTWSNRLSIALDIARALDYLHTQADPPIIHRDVKSSNILLIDDNHAKLADFGLCKLGHNKKENSMIKGSFGYVDTNYVKTGLVSTKSDVYSYGIFLLELITGLKSVQGSTTLVEWTEESRKKVDGDDLEASVKALLDPQLKDSASLEQFKVLIDVANAALVEETEARPEMSYILDRISSLCTDFILQPPQELSLKIAV